MQLPEEGERWNSPGECSLSCVSSERETRGTRGGGLLFSFLCECHRSLFLTLPLKGCLSRLFPFPFFPFLLCIFREGRVPFALPEPGQGSVSPPDTSPMLSISLLRFQRGSLAETCLLLLLPALHGLGSGFSPQPFTTLRHFGAGCRLFISPLHTLKSEKKKPKTKHTNKKE